jgi:iron complex transport system substrate-binding protein
MVAAQTRVRPILGAAALVLAALLSAQAPRPERIVSLVPSMTEALYAMGAGDAVVGVSTYDTYPPEVRSKPRVGALLDPDFERIIALKPTLVIAYATQTDLIAKLSKVGLPVFSSRHAALSDVPASIRVLGRRVGRADKGEAVALEIERAIQDIRRLVAGRPRPKTALLFGREPGSLRGLHASAGYGFMHDMLEAAGGADVFADVNRESLQVTTEVLLARAPEVIIEARPSPAWTPERIARERAVWNALPSLPAVKYNRVYILSDDRLASPGPRVAEGVRLLARTLHPDLFK